MRTKVIYGIAIVAAVMAAAQASAQKYPERKMARDGNRAYDRGEFEESEISYRRALQENPELEQAWFNLGNALFRQGKGEEAAKVYMGIAADTLTSPLNMSEASYNLGNTMLASQNLDEAIESYKQALRINPDDMEAKFNLAYAQKMKNEPPPEDEDNDDDQDQDNQNDQDQNDDQDQDNQDDQDSDGDNDQDDGQGEDQPDDEDQPEEPEPSGDDEVSIAPEDAEQMLDAIQDEEDKTREKMEAQEVPTVGHSGKNW